MVTEEFAVLTGLVGRVYAETQKELAELRKKETKLLIKLA